MTMQLISVLREEFGLTGAKEGCGYGECGACTVLLNGKPVYNCIIPAPQVVGAHVRTIEGITPEDGLHSLQEAFISHARGHEERAAQYVFVFVGEGWR